MREVYCLFTAFDTILGVKEPNYGDVFMSLLCVGIQEKQCVKLMECNIFAIDE